MRWWEQGRVCVVCVWWCVWCVGGKGDVCAWCVCGGVCGALVGKEMYVRGVCVGWCVRCGMVWDQRRWKEKRAEVEFQILTSVREERKKRTEIVE